MGRGGQRAARAGDGPGGRRPGFARSASGASRRPAPRSASAAATCGSAADTTHDEVRVLARAQRQPGGQRDPAAAADAPAGRRPGADRGDRPRQGRRRVDPELDRPAAQGPSGAAAVYAARVLKLLRRHDVGARGRRGDHSRASRPRRQAARRDAVGRQRDRDDLASRARAIWPAVCRRADVLVAAVGEPARSRAIGSRRAPIIGVGINRTAREAHRRRGVRRPPRTRPADHLRCPAASAR